MADSGCADAAVPILLEGRKQARSDAYGIGLATAYRSAKRFEEPAATAQQLLRGYPDSQTGAGLAHHLVPGTRSLERVRAGGTGAVVSRAVLIAVGISLEGHRTVLDVSVPSVRRKCIGASFSPVFRIVACMASS